MTTEPERRSNGHGRRGSDHLVRLALSAMFVALLIAVGTIVALVVQSSNNNGALDKATNALHQSNSATASATEALSRANIALAVQHRQLIESCVRLNVQRAEANLSNLADFFVDRTVLLFSTRTRPTAPRQEQRFELAFLPRLRFAVRAKRWTPLTNCASAVSTSGAGYRAPAPVRYVSKRPPESALDIVNAARETPKGSMP